eukprot:172903-Rhodomonas_salina.1
MDAFNERCDGDGSSKPFAAAPPSTSHASFAELTLDTQPPPASAPLISPLLSPTSDTAKHQLERAKKMLHEHDEEGAEHDASVAERAGWVLAEEDGDATVSSWVGEDDAEKEGEKHGLPRSISADSLGLARGGQDDDDDGYKSGEEAEEEDDDQMTASQLRSRYAAAAAAAAAGPEDEEEQEESLELSPLPR